MSSFIKAIKSSLINLKRAIAVPVFGLWRFLYVYFMPNKSQTAPNPCAKYFILGFFSANLSHGTAADLLALELEQAGKQIEKLDISDIQFGKIKRLEIPKDKMPIAGENIILVFNPDIFAHIHNAMPKGYFSHKYLIGYWVYELPTLPFGWKTAMSKFDEIWAPSRFVKAIFEKYSNKKIEIVPHAVDLIKVPNLKGDRSSIRAEIGIDEKSFIALTSFSFSSSMERKNILGTIKAFEMAFGSKSDRILIIRHINKANFPKAFERLNAAVNKSSCNIILIDGDLDKDGQQGLFQLYRACDVLLSLHRSEGFGLQMYEALKFNLPIIATAYSGNMDFLNEENAHLVPYDLVKVNDPDNIYKSKSDKWAEPNLESAARFLRIIARE